MEEIRRLHLTMKKTVPLYIGLSTGFCGSFTSFSSFMRDVFLALSNSLPSPGYHQQQGAVDTISTSSTVPRGAGFDFMAVLGVIILTLCLCLSALKFGAHIAILLDHYSVSSPLRLLRFLDRSTIFLGWGAWIGATIMAIFPPDTPHGPASHGSWAQESWRGQALFAVVSAPAGCLVRFYVSLKLNAVAPSFPLGTFAVNVFGTAVLGMAYDLQRAPLAQANSDVGGGRVGYQVLQGVMDGFCGCVTTVSTWMAEVNGLRRRHAYVYAGASIGVSLALLIVTVGTVKWTVGWETPVCAT